MHHATSEDVVKHLVAPCMKSVTALGWHSGAARRISPEALEPFIANIEIIPDVRHLHYTGQALHYLLLRHRQITRLSTDWSSLPSLKYEDLSSLRCQISHMSVLLTQYDSHLLFRTIAKAPHPFRNLQHIGTFLLNSTTSSELLNELLRALSQLKALERLVSLDAAFDYTWNLKREQYNLIFQGGLHQVSELFPALRRVFLHWKGSSTDIWVLSTNWECQAQTCEITSFDLVSDFNPPPWE
ncbi:5409_t:CDS:2, partial [Acaulospora colombiana]